LPDVPQSAWPELPDPGQLVRLPLEPPPLFLEAIGYLGGNRFVGVAWPEGRFLWDDGECATSADRESWSAIFGHPKLRSALAPYSLGDLAARSVHWLLVDRDTRTLLVGLVEDVQDVLEANEETRIAKSTLPAVTGGWNVEENVPTDPTSEGAARRRDWSRSVSAWLDAVDAPWFASTPEDRRPESLRVPLSPAEPPRPGPFDEPRRILMNAYRGALSNERGWADQLREAADPVTISFCSVLITAALIRYLAHETGRSTDEILAELNRNFDPPPTGS
jgi:hypothetical protein